MRVLLSIALLSLAVFTVVDARRGPRWHELRGYTFERFEADFRKHYPTKQEREMRRQLFEAQLDKVRQHNAGNHSWKEGINHMSDWTHEEMTGRAGYRQDIGYMQVEARRERAARRWEHESRQFNATLPETVDWRELGVVTAVKDQGRCGSCWAHATTESIESFYALATGELSVLSQQQINDCTGNPEQCGGTGGCGGATGELAMQNIVDQGGQAEEWTYPYVSYHGDNFDCHYNASVTFPVASISDYVTLPSNEYLPLMQAVNLGPLAVTVDASNWGAYEAGVFDGCNQTNPELDHLVQLVGYGTDSTLGDYWLVRNSWTAKWGEDGYIRIARTAYEGKRCGVDIDPADGTGCLGGPPSVTVCGTCGILYDSLYPIIY